MKFKLSNKLISMEILSLYFKDEISIINDYMGLNKYQLNYKKVMDEFKYSCYYCDINNKLDLMYSYNNMIYSKSMFHYRSCSGYNLQYYNYIRTKRGCTVGELPKRYYYSNG